MQSEEKETKRTGEGWNTVQTHLQFYSERLYVAGAFPFLSFSKARDFQERLNFKSILAFLMGRNLLVVTAKKELVI